MHEYQIKALNSHVLAVASVNVEVGDWAAYIGAVPGKSHNKEFMEVVSTGSKIPENFAEVLFPMIYRKYRWRS